MRSALTPSPSLRCSLLSGGGNVLSSDTKLVPRISSFLTSLSSSAPVTVDSIVAHLRSKYPEYARKPNSFNKQVEKLCEKMRKEAMEENEGAEVPAAAAATEKAAAAASAADSSMSDVQILSTTAPGAAAATPVSAVAASFASAISFAAPSFDRSASAPPAAAASAAGTPAGSPDAGNKKRRKDESGGASNASEAEEFDDSSADDGSSGDESENSVVELAGGAKSASASAAAPGGGVNSTLRNLYNKQATAAASTAPPAATGANGAPAASPSDRNERQRKPKEKIVYTQNSTKKNTKKKAAALRAGAAGHFTSNDGNVDAVAAAGVGEGGGGGGAGSNWHPEILHPTASYADLGGIEAILQEVRELIEYPLSHPEIYAHLGVQAPRGVLLHGPPGCGKTLLAHCIAGELGVPFLKISAPEIVSGMSGESEQKLRTLFADALAAAPCIMFLDEIDAITPKRATAQREMERRIVAQLLTCMDSLSTSANTGGGDPSKIVIVIGATNRPDSLDPALRRAGRFDREISLGIPDEAARARILSVMCREMKVEGGLGGFDWLSIAKKAVGYVGADLMALTREAAVVAINRIFKTVLPTPLMRPQVTAHIMGAAQPPALSLLAPGSGSPKLGAMNPPHASAPISEAAAALTASLNAAAATALATGSSSPRVGSTDQAHLIPDSRSAVAASDLHSRSRASDKLRAHVEPLSESQLAPLFITYQDFIEALRKVQPSSKREGFATIPDVTWNDIGALDDLREELNMTILQPILNPLQFESIGLTTPAGVLLFGPPGCGKTLVAKAIANESGASFLSIKGPELLNQYVGQSERAVRKVFQRARASAPCVIFFDELDALVPKRGGGGGGDGGSQVSERVVNQLLTEVSRANHTPAHAFRVRDTSILGVRTHVDRLLVLCLLALSCIQMDGLEERRFVFVIAATNRPDIIDPAMLRPGRLDKLLYVKLPSAPERASILRKHLRRTPLSSEVDVVALSNDPRGEGYSGADIAALCREATLQALREAQQKQRLEMASQGVVAHLPQWGSVKADATTAAAAGAAGSSAAPAVNAAPLPVLVGMSHFHFAFSKVFPSVSVASRQKYDRMHRMLSRARSTLSNDEPGASHPNAPTGTAVAKIEEEEDEVPRGASAVAPRATRSPLLQVPSASSSMPPPSLPKSSQHSPKPVTSFPAATASTLPPHTGTILGSMTATAQRPATAGSANMDTQ